MKTIYKFVNLLLYYLNIFFKWSCLFDFWCTGDSEAVLFLPLFAVFKSQDQAGLPPTPVCRMSRAVSHRTTNTT